LRKNVRFFTTPADAEAPDSAPASAATSSAVGQDRPLKNREICDYVAPTRKSRIN